MAMINLSHSQATFTGGNYTQVNNIQQQTPWDRLQSAAAPSAFHDAGDNFDAPKCHHNTRIAVMKELRDFALRRSNTGHAKILWLNGAAGAGKSAIARSLCEEYAATNSLLASFFFNRSDAPRNNHKAFVATITYQVFTHIPPHYQSLILDVIEHDPLVFTRSVGAQFQALIVQPLHDLFETGHFSAIRKFLIVIDGLDECSTAAAQLDILRAIQKTFNQSAFPFRFLITSRPEHDLQPFFRSSRMIPLLHRLELDDAYRPDLDIERFLVDKLQEVRDTHPFKNSIPCIWPPINSIQALVAKSSGQFIYASLVVKYVSSIRHQPHKRLDYVVNLCPPKGDLPFSELDALYLHILSCAEGDINLALQLIGFHDIDAKLPIEDLALLLRSDSNDLLAALCDFQSLLRVYTDHGGVQTIQILHKSFLDFLFDSTRSGKYHISKPQLSVELAAKCMQYLSLKDVQNRNEYGLTNTHWAAAAFLCDYADDCQFIDNIPLLHESLTSFSLMNAVDNILHRTRFSSSAHETQVYNFIDIFFAKLFDQLDIVTDYALHESYESQLSELNAQHPFVYLRHDALTSGLLHQGRSTGIYGTRSVSRYLGGFCRGCTWDEPPTP